MAYLRTLPEARLLELFQAFPELWRPLLEAHEALLRGPSPFSVAERELLAAFVSGLNACGYCHGVHARVAERFGMDEGVLAALLEDVDTALVADTLKPVLHYVRKLTLAPAKVTPEDAEAVFRAGWDDRALTHAAMVCGLFNLMNRVVEGLGIEADAAYAEVSSKRLHEGGYAGLKRHLPEPLPGPQVSA